MPDDDRKLLPPSAKITFDQTLVDDDGQLSKALTEGGDLSAEQAEQTVADYVTRLRQSLNGDERAELPGVGHFIQRHDGRVSFASLDGGYRPKSSMGLPPVNLVPIRRTTDEAVGGTNPEVATSPVKKETHGPAITTAASTDAEDSGGLSRSAWYAIATILIVVAIWAAYGLFQSVGSTMATDDRQPTRPRTERQTTTPRERPIREELDNTPITTSPVPARDVAPGDPPRLNNASSGTSIDSTTDRTPVAGTTTEPNPSNAAPNEPFKALVGANSAIIAIGVFTEQADITDHLSRISRAGFKPWIKPAGRNTRLGVEIRYDTRRQRSDLLEQVRTDVADAAVVMLVNGRYVLRSPE